VGGGGASPEPTKERGSSRCTGVGTCERLKLLTEGSWKKKVGGGIGGGAGWGVLLRWCGGGGGGGGGGGWGGGGGEGGQEGKLKPKLHMVVLSQRILIKE